MPKATYRNLKTEKQDIIFQAAFTEFSNCRFSESSINQIIKTAGISRGSFYQYFEDKEDVFLMVFERVMRQKRRNVPDFSVSGPALDVFEMCRRSTVAAHAWGLADPRYARLASLMEIDTCDFIQGLRRASMDELRALIERDQVAGKIRRELDAGILAGVLYSVLVRAEAGTAGDEGSFPRHLDQIISIIREGAAC